MKFSEFPYVRPDMDAACAYMDNLTKKFSQAKSAEEEIAIITDYRDKSIEVENMMSLCYIRNTQNTNDEFYKAEQEFFDQKSPTYSNSTVNFGKEILKSKHLDAIKKEFGDIFISNLEFASKSMSEEIIPLMEEENKLVSEYQLFNANAKVKFQGKEMTISAVSKFTTDDDRSVRKAAMQALSDFYISGKEFLDTTFDKLVKNRTKQAQMMGYKTYTPLGYIRMNRNSYNEKDVEVFRKQIADVIVPVIVKAKSNQAKRLGLDKITIYDNNYRFADGNPKGCESAEEMMELTRQVFTDMSPLFKEYIDFMLEHELYDAPDRPGKRIGAYCSGVPTYECPFVFLNYNGTEDAVRTTFHEFGHGFEGYMNRKDKNAYMLSYTMDIAETHSMSMEFLSWKGIGRFFNETDLKKYKTSQVEDALTFLSYGTMVDHFQHIIYANPDLTPEERNAEWAKLEKIYRPYLDFDGIEFYAKGAMWQRQQHIYSSPFYYIDYVLAQTVALQFWQLAEKDYDKALNTYVEHVKRGGSMKFTDLIRAAGLKVPFDEGSLSELAETIEKTL